MDDHNIPPSKTKSGITLPPIKKTKPQDFRNNLKGFTNQKGMSATKGATMRRTGPRGG